MQTEIITCKNCGNQFSGNYCNNCGEKVFTEHDRTAAHFLEEGFHFLTHFDGTLITTIRTMFTRPGKVSVDYAHGIRKRYFRLLSLFLLLVVVYLLFPAFEGLNMRLNAHEHHRLYGAYAREKVDTIKIHNHWSEKEVAEVFHQKSEKISKILLVIIIPFTALAVWAVTFRKRKYAFDQLVFATEMNCFYLLWGFLILPLLLMGSEWVYHLISKTYFPINDDETFFMISIPLIVYVAVAGRRFFRIRIWQSVVFALYFLVIHVFIVHYLYKFILFATVINQIN
jgi:hypothetical protein